MGEMRHQDHRSLLEHCLQAGTSNTYENQPQSQTAAQTDFVVKDECESVLTFLVELQSNSNTAGTLNTQQQNDGGQPADLNFAQTEVALQVERESMFTSSSDST